VRRAIGANYDGIRRSHPQPVGISDGLEVAHREICLYCMHAFFLCVCIRGSMRLFAFGVLWAWVGTNETDTGIFEKVTKEREEVVRVDGKEKKAEVMNDTIDHTWSTSMHRLT
jgi:hypothetical protein